MELTTYDIFYILGNVLRTYTAFKMINVFFDREKTDGSKKYVLCSVYFIITNLVALAVDIPVVILTINIVGLLILTLDKRGNMRQRMMSVMFVYIIGICVECIVALLGGHMIASILSKSDYVSIFGLLCMHLLFFILMLLMQNFKNVKNGKSVPVFYWISIITIPLASVFIIVNLLNALELIGRIMVLLCIAFLFMINISTFLLYDVIIKSMEYKMEKRLLSEQNNYYEKQFESMKSSLENIRSVRHDMINHMSSLKYMLKNREYMEAEEYTDKMLNQCEMHRESVRSGNLVIDSILNYKLEEAKKRHIDVRCETNIPETLEIESFDMTVILGNLLDNAINACSGIGEDKRRIAVDIRFDKGILVIKVQNTYNGIVAYENEEIITTRKDRENHGLGLQNIRKAVERNWGALDIVHTKENFLVTAMIYTKKSAAPASTKTHSPNVSAKISTST